MGIDQLDSLLEYMYINRRYQYFDEIHNKSNIQHIEINTLVMLNKLAKDENIIVEEIKKTTRNGNNIIVSTLVQKSYFISFRGILFREAGGYAAERESRELEIEVIKTDLILRKKNDRRLVIGTYAVAFGAISLVVWEIFQYFFL